MPTVSVAIMVGVLMLQLPPISTVDAADCVHPGGCVSCGSQTSIAAVIKADRDVAATLNEYTESALDSGRGIRDYGNGTLRAGATFSECNEVAQVLRDVMGWGTGASILGCGYNGGGPFGYLLMGACDTALSQIQELVNTVYCLNKPNGCVSCPAGASGLLQADDRALAALTDIVTAEITVPSPEVFTDFTKGASARGGPGIFARGGHVQCREAREILVGKLTAIDANFELGCTALGFLKGCSNPATIGVLQALIDGLSVGAITLTTTAAATTTVPAVCNQEPKAGDGEITCSGGAQQRCISVGDEALHTINCLLDGEGIALVTVAQGTNVDRCITTSSDAHCQAVSAYFYTHVPDGGQACNGDCTWRCPGKGFLMSKDCEGRGLQYLKNMIEAYNSKRSIVHITLSTDFGGLYFSAPNILDAGCEDNADTSPSTIAMTAFFLGQGLDVYVRCNGKLELYMTGKDIDDAADAMDIFHRAIPGNKGAVPGQTYHIAFNVDTFVETTTPLRPDAGRNLATNIQEVLTSFATTANAAASLTTTTTITTTTTTAKIATVTTTRTTTTRTPYPNMPLTASSDLDLRDLGCTSHGKSAATHAFAALLDEMGCAGTAVHCLHDKQNQLCMSRSILESCGRLANAMEVQAKAQGLPSTTCESAACWIRFSYQSSSEDGCMLLKLSRRNGPAANNQIVANLNALLGLETPSTASTTTTIATPAAAFPTPNRTDLQCDRTNRNLATSNCINVKAGGGVVRASGGTRFLEEYYANRNPQWKGNGTIMCWTDSKDGGLHDIVFEDVELCDAFQRIIGQSEGVLECEEIGENDDDFPVGLTFIRYATKADCGGMVGIPTLTLGKTTATTAAPTTAPATPPVSAPTAATPTATSSSTISDKGGGSNGGTDQAEDANDDSNNDTSNGGGGGSPGDGNSTDSSSADNKNSTRGDGGNPTNTTNGNSSVPPTVPQQSSSSTSTIVGVLVALILAVAVVGFILWRQKTSSGGGIPHINGNAAAAAPANGSQVGGVPSTYHNRMYNIDVNSNQEGANVDFGSDYATGPNVVPAANAPTPSRTHASTVYSIPLEDGGGGGNAGGGSGDGDDAYGGVTYVAALNQNAPEYATAIEAGSTNALYAVVSLEGRGGGGNAGGASSNTSSGSAASTAAAAAGGDGGTDNHYDLPAPGERRRGPKKKKKKKKQQQQQQEEEAPAMLYDVAQHAGSGSAASQSAEYSHLSPRGGGAVGGERNNMYDLGPQQRGGGGGAGGDGAMYEELDSSV